MYLPVADPFIDLPLPAYDVVIPCYNRAHVVADALDSVLAQEHAPTRVILVDDGSRDNSAAVIRRLADAHAHARVEAAVLPRNGGASHARNVGVSLCRSPWIAFLDSDDVWLPGAARALLEPAEAFDVVVGFFARADHVGTTGAPECGWDGGDIRGALATGGVIGPSWSVVRRATVSGVAGFDPSFHNCNDWDFYTRAAAAGARFGRVSHCVALYRTVAGDRLVDDVAINAVNADRVLAHPYLAPLRAVA